jgi:hypothetical protein
MSDITITITEQAIIGGITGDTSTAFAGLLKASAGKVAQAVEGTDYPSVSSVTSLQSRTTSLESSRVRFDAPQTLTSEQKERARDNVGAMPKSPDTGLTYVAKGDQWIPLDPDGLGRYVLMYDPNEVVDTPSLSDNNGGYERAASDPRIIVASVSGIITDIVAISANIDDTVEIFYPLSIEILDMSGNGITIAPDLSKLRNLIYVNLSSNYLSSSPIFTGLDTLENILLASNQLTAWPDITFLPSLLGIDLSNNNITTAPITGFTIGTPLLDSILIDYNNIVSEETNLFFTRVWQHANTNLLLDGIASALGTAIDTATNTDIENLVAAGWTLGFSEVARTITGFAYPSETLTANLPSRWTVGGLLQDGATTTYTVTVDDIGKEITASGSAPVTVWTPQDIAQVREFFWSRDTAGFATSESGSPSAPVDNMEVGLWRSLVSGCNATQATSANRPKWKASALLEGACVEFDGVNDQLNISRLTTLNNVTRSTMFVGAVDLAPTVGGAHRLAFYSQGGSSTRRIELRSKAGSTPNVEGIFVRVDGGSATTQFATTQPTGYAVYEADANYAANAYSLIIDGAIIGTGTVASGAGNSSATNSQEATLGSIAFPANIQLAAVVICTGSLSATDASRIRRFIGLLGGKNIPLV